VLFINALFINIRIMVLMELINLSLSDMFEFKIEINFAPKSDII